MKLKLNLGSKLFSTLSSLFFRSLILSLAPLFFLLLSNPDKVNNLNFFKAFTFTFLIFLLIYLSVNKKVKNFYYKSFLLYLIIFLIFYSGKIFTLFRIVGLFDIGFIISLVLIFLLSIIFPYLVYIKDRHDHKWSKTLTKFVNNFVVIILILLALSVSIRYFNKMIYFYNYSNLDNKIVNKITTKENDSNFKGNIYYIVLDGHSNYDFLYKYYGYDNQYFYNELDKLGFFTPEKSTSNYSQTVLSFASSLNMDYLNIDSAVDSVIGHYFLYKSIDNNNIMKVLNRDGYKMHFIFSGWEIVEKGNSLKTFLNFSEFEKIYLKTSLFYYFLPRNFDHIIHRNKTLSSLKNITTYKQSQNNFVIAHIISPHPPFIFDEIGNLQYQDNNEFDLLDGKWKEKKGRSPELYRELYLQQLKYIDLLTLELVKDLVNESETKPIIILQADHGPGSYESYNGEQSEVELKERHSILNAYYFPDQDYSKLYDVITPVNSFRIVLDQYFGQELGLIEDKNYFSTYEEAFVFKDVTEIVQ